MRCRPVEATRFEHHARRWCVHEVPYSDDGHDGTHGQGKTRAPQSHADVEDDHCLGGSLEVSARDGKVDEPQQRWTEGRTAEASACSWRKQGYQRPLP